MRTSRSPGGRQPLGQHFLRGERTVARILDALGASEGEWVVEVGPGRGALTRPLVSRGVRVLAVEVDAALAAALETELGGGSFRITVADARSADLASLLAAAGAAPPVPLVANLPYESATPMLRSFVRRHGLLSRLVVMVQKEVAERLAARAGDDAYGFLSVDVGAYATARRLFDVSPGEFSPPPRVTSSVVELVPRPAADGVEGALAVASAGFSARRKTLLNSLSSRWPRESVAAALEGAGVSPRARAEELSIAEFAALAGLLGPAG